MTYTDAIVVFVVLIVLIFGLLWGPTYLRRERYDCGRPGRGRAYEASTAGAVSHVIERSA
jgi:hypothetical protein